MASKVETLAKLYLEGEFVEISDIAQVELCEWLMSEFQQLPNSEIVLKSSAHIYFGHSPLPKLVFP
ncbi:hypothetical protein [Nostoc sp.]|uniref:hypothetical protein n=1 Tax=Nostoc sp. TaxID=1180 RepID=UPI002FFCF856